MRAYPPALLILICALIASLAPQGAVRASPLQTGDVTGGVNIFTTQPDLICVGDTVVFEGAASVDFPEIPTQPGEIPLAPLAFISLQYQAQNGQVTPKDDWFPTDFTYFTVAYKATKPGPDVLTITLNDSAATYQEPIQVQEKCDYDVYLLSTMYYTVDLGDEEFRSITNIAGTGVMKRDRQGSAFYQGDGRFHLEENMLSKPAMCVQYYMPPLIFSWKFDLDGHLDSDANMLDVLLSFLPYSGPPVRHGNSVCIDADGGRGEGYGILQGPGDPSKVGKIQTSVPLGGGTRQVAIEGEGMKIVQSQGTLDYIATLTVIPR